MQVIVKHRHVYNVLHHKSIMSDVRDSNRVLRRNLALFGHGLDVPQPEQRLQEFVPLFLHQVVEGFGVVDHTPLFPESSVISLNDLL